VDEGQSASSKARELRELAAAALAEAGRLTQEAAAWEAGAEGERRVAEALSGLAKGPNVIVLNDRLLRPGFSQANLDHVVLSPGGAHLVDAKNWAGNVTVYEGSLWRHKADGQGGRSSECMNVEVDKVRHMAETMETLSSCVVEPVLCLAGRNAGAFGADQLIRGVHIVSVDRISDWFVGLDRTQPDAAVPILAQRLKELFPTATGPWSSLTPPSNTRIQRRTSRQPPAPPRSKGARGSGHVPEPSRNRRRGKHGVAKSLGGLLGLVIIGLFGAPVLNWCVLQVSAAATHLASTPGSSTHASAQAGQLSMAATRGPLVPSGPPCLVLTESAISKALGVRVYPVATASPDTCQWGLRLDDQSTVVVSASTGWLPWIFTIANKADRAIFRDGLGSPEVSIIVPQHAAVPGSMVPAAQITQPIKVSLENIPLGKSGRKMSNDQARGLITRWAQQVATAMPQGPGADSIHP
jgi:hypothetical protein